MVKDLFDLDGKVAIVTGASRGLGQGMAIALAQAGANVVGVGQSDMTLTKEEIYMIPFGTKIYPILVKLRIYKEETELAAEEIQNQKNIKHKPKHMKD